MKKPQDRADAGDSPRSPRLRSKPSTPEDEFSESLKADKPRLRLKLNTAEDARRELARVYREARSGRIEVGDASRLANILQILVRCIETSDIEARVVALETLKNETPNRSPTRGRRPALRSA